MRKILLATAVALAMGGCAAQQSGGPQSVQVRDLSMGRHQGAASSYTVQTGDTIYGIAWRNEMDFRRLAQLNGLKPPYRLEPDQQLRLNEQGAASDPQTAAAANTTQGSDAKARAPQDAQSSQNAQASQNAQQSNPDWLAPDEEAIRRNQGIVVRPLDQPLQGNGQPSGSAASGQSQTTSGGSNSGDDGSGDGNPDNAPSDNASSSNTSLGSASPGNSSPNNQAPGPVYNYGSPGADGKLSQRDQSERDAQEKSRQSQDVVVAVAQDEVAKAEQENSSAQNSTSEPTAQANEPAVTSQPQAAQQRPKRTYTPATNIGWQWPSQGNVVNGFGEGESTTAGIDIAGQKGQPVKAAGPGIVVYAGSGVRGYGNLVLLKHNDQFLSAYAHNDKLQVKENDVIETGEVIATMGDTDADSVMLHFEVRKGGQPQNPLDFLPKR